MLSGAQVLRTTKRHSLIWAVRSIISTQLNAINAFCSNAPVATLLTESPMHFNRLYWPEYMNKFKY